MCSFPPRTNPLPIPNDASSGMSLVSIHCRQQRRRHRDTRSISPRSNGSKTFVLRSRLLRRLRGKLPLVCPTGSSRCTAPSHLTLSPPVVFVRAWRSGFHVSAGFDVSFGRVGESGGSKARVGEHVMCLRACFPLVWFVRRAWKGPVILAWLATTSSSRSLPTLLGLPRSPYLSRAGRTGARGVAAETPRGAPILERTRK